MAGREGAIDGVKGHGTVAGREFVEAVEEREDEPAFQEGMGAVCDAVTGGQARVVGAEAVGHPGVQLLLGRVPGGQGEDDGHGAPHGAPRCEVQE